MTANPEQEARAAVRASFGYTLAELNRKDSVMTTVKIAQREVRKFGEQEAALDLYGRERYLAGKVEMTREMVCAWAGDNSCHGCRAAKEQAEADYAACVAALREAKHG